MLRHTAAVVATSKAAHAARSVFGPGRSYEPLGVEYPCTLYKMESGVHVAWFESPSRDPTELVIQICKKLPNLEWLFVLGTAIGRRDDVTGAVRLTSMALQLERQLTYNVTLQCRAKVQEFLQMGSVSHQGSARHHIAAQVVQRLLNAPNRTLPLEDLRDIIVDDGMYWKVRADLVCADIEVLPGGPVLPGVSLRLPQEADEARLISFFDLTDTLPLPPTEFGPVLSTSIAVRTPAVRDALYVLADEMCTHPVGIDTAGYGVLDAVSMEFPEVCVLPVSQVVDVGSVWNDDVVNAAVWLHRFIQWLA